MATITLKGLSNDQARIMVEDLVKDQVQYINEKFYDYDIPNVLNPKVEQVNREGAEDDEFVLTYKEDTDNSEDKDGDGVEDDEFTGDEIEDQATDRIEDDEVHMFGTGQEE